MIKAKAKEQFETMMNLASRPSTPIEEADTAQRRALSLATRHLGAAEVGRAKVLALTIAVRRVTICVIAINAELASDTFKQIWNEVAKYSNKQ
jgi:hypothetical protein